MKKWLIVGLSVFFIFLLGCVAYAVIPDKFYLALKILGIWFLLSIAFIPIFKHFIFFKER